jgi:hypothetical protein
VAGAQGACERATRLFGAAEALSETTGAPLPPTERALYDRALTAVRDRLSGAVFALAWAEGRTMPPEQAIAYALEEAGDG